MDYTACCTDLEDLIAAPKRKRGLGLTIVVAKWGTSFILEYREDWRLERKDFLELARLP